MGKSKFPDTGGAREGSWCEIAAKAAEEQPAARQKVRMISVGARTLLAAPPHLESTRYLHLSNQFRRKHTTPRRSAFAVDEDAGTTFRLPRT